MKWAVGAVLFLGIEISFASAQWDLDQEPNLMSKWMGLELSIEEPIKTEKKTPSDSDLELHSSPLVEMKCPALPPRQPPSNVNDLRPDDFKVVMAIGDSITLGMAARYPSSLTTEPKASREFRGANFVTGADSDAVSLGKLIQHYNPQVAGLSHGSASFEFCYGPLCPTGGKIQPFRPEIYGLNAAQSGAWGIKSNVKNQFKYLDKYYAGMTSTVTKNATQDPWKLMVVQLGGNNMCIASCRKGIVRNYFSTTRFAITLRYTIEELRKRYKNMVVIISGTPKITNIGRVVAEDAHCRAFRTKEWYGCPCLVDIIKKKNVTNLIDSMTKDYNDVAEQIAQEYKAKNWADFSVMYDGGLREFNTTIDNIAKDCLHPTTSMHSLFAIQTWNNLFRSPSERRYSTNETDIFCPTENTRVII